MATYNKKLIVANWKMNPETLQEAKELFRAVQRGVQDLRDVEVIICPPFVYLEKLISSSASAKGYGGLAFGSQDCFYEQSGAYTGEVSPSMLKSLGCTYVILGHSERRQYLGETNEIVNKKVKAALNAGLKIILCIGEDTRDSFDAKGHWTHELDPKLKDELVLALDGVPKSKIGNLVVAYEPVWAIGTGNAATPDDVLSAKIFIRKIIGDMSSRKTAETVRVLYGGSTDRKNAGDFIKEGHADGLLVGGSSLDVEEFVAMIKSVT